MIFEILTGEDDLTEIEFCFDHTQSWYLMQVQFIYGQETAEGIVYSFEDWVECSFSILVSEDFDNSASLILGQGSNLTSFKGVNGFYSSAFVSDSVVPLEDIYEIFRRDEQVLADC